MLQIEPANTSRKASRTRGALSALSAEATSTILQSPQRKVRRFRPPRLKIYDGIYLLPSKTNAPRPGSNVTKS
jgi:hypothetical protein